MRRLVALFLAVAAPAAGTRAEPPTLDTIKREVAAVRARYQAFSVQWTWEVGFRTGNAPLTYAERELYRLDVAGDRYARDAWRLPVTATGVESALAHSLHVFDGARTLTIIAPEYGRAKAWGRAMIGIDPGEDRTALGAVWPFDFRRALWYEWDGQPLDLEIGDIEWTPASPREEKLGEVPTVLLDLSRTFPGGAHARRRLWLDPARSWNPLRTDFLQREPDGSWKLLEGRLLSDLRQVDGVWVPFRIEIRDPEAETPTLVRSLTVTKFSFGEADVRTNLFTRPWTGRASVSDRDRLVNYELDDQGREMMAIPAGRPDTNQPKVLQDQNRAADAAREQAMRLDAERAARHAKSSAPLWPALALVAAVTLVAGLLARARLRRP